MVRAPCCEKMGLKKGPWTREEDQILVNYIKAHGHSNWRALPKQSGLLRCGKSCRLRWINYLRPDIKRGNFTREEEDSIIKLHEMLGNRWSAIAARLPGRTDNEIKNVWHTHLKKRLKQSHQHGVSDTTGNPMKALNLDDIDIDTDIDIDMAVKIEQDAMNVNTSHMTETDSQEPRQPLSPSHSSWSNDDITSTSNITKNSDDINENENSSSTNADGSSSTTMQLESHWDFPQADESFWSEVLSVDSIGDQSDADVGKEFRGVDMDAEVPQWQLQFSPWVAMEPIYGQSTSKDTIGDMDFWLDLFTSATLPEM